MLTQSNINIDTIVNAVLKELKEKLFITMEAPVFGFEITIPGVPSISPLKRTGALTPSVKPSVNEIST